jgi:hypothetical protein
MSWRRGIAIPLAAAAFVTIAVFFGACGGDGGGSDAPGGERAQAVAKWLTGHGCENVTRTSAKGVAPDPDYGLFLERSKSAVLVACDRGPEDSAIVWEFDDYDTMSRSLHVHAEQIRAQPYCRLKHVAFTIGNVKDGVDLCRSMLGGLVCGSLCGRRSPNFVSGRRWTKADPRPLVVGPCDSHPASAAQLAGSSGPVSGTHVILMSPVDRRGCLRPNIEIRSRDGGGCLGGRATTHRCAWGGLVTNHCWPAVFDPPDATAAVCMYEPWSSEAHRIDLAPDPPRWFRPGRRRALDPKAPWGVELLDGTRCLQQEHFSFLNDKARFKGGIVGYSCDPPGPVLVGHLHSSGPMWTFRTARKVHRRYIPEGTTAVRTAWYPY